MSGVRWIRLDTDMFENPKFLYILEDRQYKTIAIHLQAMCYSGRIGLDGYIPKSALPRLGAVLSDAKKLVTYGLWEPAQGGWQIHGWGEYQATSSEVKARSERARQAAITRWKPQEGGPMDDL